MLWSLCGHVKCSQVWPLSKRCLGRDTLGEDALHDYPNHCMLTVNTNVDSTTFAVYALSSLDLIKQGGIDEQQKVHSIGRGKNGAGPKPLLFTPKQTLAFFLQYRIRHRISYPSIRYWTLIHCSVSIRRE
jgi:hypothetical protein